MKAIQLVILLIIVSSSNLFSQLQWSGNSNTTDPIYRSGNVGIGLTGAPSAPLQFSNTTASRKIVLLNGALNNNFQFYGFGTATDVLRYSISHPGASHVFYAGDLAGTGEKELLRIKGTGNIKFFPEPGKKVVVYENGDNNHEYWGLGFDWGQIKYQIGSPGDNHVFYTGNPANPPTITQAYSTELLRITGSGRLQFPNVEQKRRLVLYQVGDNDHEFAGIGMKPFELTYQVAGTTNSHVFYTAASNSSSTELMRIKGNGNVGIGVDPQDKLHITNGALRIDALGTLPGINLPFNAGGNSASINFGSSLTASGSFTFQKLSNGGSAPNGLYLKYNPNSSSSNVVMFMSTATGNNIGIGGTNASDKLHIQSGVLRIQGTNAIGTSGTGNLRIGSNGTTYSWIESAASPLVLNPQATDLNNNYVAIGFNPAVTNSPLRTVASDYRLAVNGKIICTELKVKTGNWPDYVFSPEYKLMPLDSVEQYIEANHHLPEVPSAKEMEENGINSGEMDNLMMKKLEELTLYMIEQKKEIDQLKEENKKMKETIDQLTK